MFHVSKFTIQFLSSHFLSSCFVNLFLSCVNVKNITNYIISSRVRNITYRAVKISIACGQLTIPIAHIPLNASFKLQHDCNISYFILRNKLQKQPSEVFYKKVVFKISQYSQENNCVGVSLLKRDSSTGVSLWTLPHL